MFKTRIDNQLSESLYNTLLEAKKESLLSFKENKNAKLLEILNEDDEVIFSKERELEEPTPEQVENGVDSVLRSLLSNLWATIDEYNSAITTLVAENADSNKIETLNQIVNDLSIHVGMLESCLSE